MSLAYSDRTILLSVPKIVFPATQQNIEEKLQEKQKTVYCIIH